MKDETEHQEFPKMLYQGGAVRTEEGRPVPPHHTRTVADADEEAEARAEGFTDALEPEAPEVAEVAEEGEHEADEPAEGEQAPVAEEPAEGAEVAEEPEAQV